MLKSLTFNLPNIINKSIIISITKINNIKNNNPLKKQTLWQRKKKHWLLKLQLQRK